MLNDVLVTYRVGQTNNLQANKSTNPLEFIKAYTKVYEFLNEKGIYKEYEETYKTATINSIIFNHKSTKTLEAKAEIRNHLSKHGFKDLGLDKLKREDFKSNTIYINWLEIIDQKEE